MASTEPSTDATLEFWAEDQRIVDDWERGMADWHRRIEDRLKAPPGWWESILAADAAAEAARNPVQNAILEVQRVEHTARSIDMGELVLDPETEMAHERELNYARGQLLHEILKSRQARPEVPAPRTGQMLRHRVGAPRQRTARRARTARSRGPDDDLPSDQPPLGGFKWGSHARRWSS
jgi:hypothetical protein